MSEKHHAWLFQYNLQLHPFDRYPTVGEQAEFAATRFRHQMHVGDLVFLFETGPSGGLRGWGLILQEPNHLTRRVLLQIYVWESSPVASRKQMLSLEHLWNKWRRNLNYALESKEAARLAKFFPKDKQPAQQALNRAPNGDMSTSDTGASNFELVQIKSIELQKDGPESATRDDKKTRTDLKTSLERPPEDLKTPLALQTETEDPRSVMLWFGTNREPAPSGSESHFTGRRSIDDSVHYGRCTVFVPKSHKFGGLQTPWWKRLFSEDSSLQLTTVDSLQEASFWEELKESLGQGEENESLMLFVHGYRVSFEGAALRTAQLAYDLKMRHAAFFSWPSAGDATSYIADEASARHAALHLGKFLQEVERRCAAANQRMHVIAHSMGSRVLVQALEVLAAAQWQPTALENLVFAAPDEDAATFTRAVGSMLQVSRNRTLYASNGDKPVWLSAAAHAYPRAGYLPPVTIAQGLDTIDASHIDKTFLGHSDFATERPLLNDLFALLCQGLPPDQRASIRIAFEGTNQYWKLS